MVRDKWSLLPSIAHMRELSDKCTARDARCKGESCNLYSWVVSIVILLQTQFFACSFHCFPKQDSNLVVGSHAQSLDKQGI